MLIYIDLPHQARVYACGLNGCLPPLVCHSFLVLLLLG